MLRKNLFGKNLDYAALQDKYGYDVVTITPRTKNYSYKFPNIKYEKNFSIQKI